VIIGFFCDAAFKTKKKERAQSPPPPQQQQQQQQGWPLGKKRFRAFLSIQACQNKSVV
jgi:hypothetical protein